MSTTINVMDIAQKAGTYIIWPATILMLDP